MQSSTHTKSLGLRLLSHQRWRIATTGIHRSRRKVGSTALLFHTPVSRDVHGFAPSVTKEHASPARKHLRVADFASGQCTRVKNRLNPRNVSQEVTNQSRELGAFSRVSFSTTWNTQMSRLHGQVHTRLGGEPPGLCSLGRKRKKARHFRALTQIDAFMPLGSSAASSSEPTWRTLSSDRTRRRN